MDRLIHALSTAQVLSAHCDDSAYSIGGSLSLYASIGAKVITVFSISNFINTGSSPTVETRTALRKLEDYYCYKTLNEAIELQYLDKLDAPLRLRMNVESTSDESLKTEGLSEASEIVLELGRILNPSKVVFAPLGLGGHIDHLVVSKVGSMLSKEDWRVFFYEDLPFAAKMSNQEIRNRAMAVGQSSNLLLAPTIVALNDVSQNKETAIRLIRYDKFRTFEKGT